MSMLSSRCCMMNVLRTLGLWAVVASFLFSSLDARATAQPPSSSTFVYAGHFGPADDASGVLRAPTFLVVDPVTHDIFVSEYGNNRVQRFNQQGLPQGQIGSLGQDPGFLDGVQGVAVDPERRILYVADIWRSRV